MLLLFQHKLLPKKNTYISIKYIENIHYSTLHNT